LDVSKLNTTKLKAKAQELWENIVKLETEKYDLEERMKRQDYDVSLALKKYSIKYFWEILIFHILPVERVEGTSKAAAETQGPEEGS